MFSFLNAIDKLTLVISLASKRLGITDLIAYVSIYKAISSAATQIPPNKFMKTNIPIKNSLEKRNTISNSLIVQHQMSFIRFLENLKLIKLKMSGWAG